MGNSKSKSKLSTNTVCVTGPNVNYMRNNYGPDSVSQLTWWVTECGFPDGGSFSLKQLESLKGNLTQMEKDNVRKKKNRVEVNWTAFHMWKLEAEKRLRKTQSTPKRVSVQNVQNPQSSTIRISQSLQSLKCFSDDPELDGPPPGPRLGAAASCGQVRTDTEEARARPDGDPMLVHRPWTLKDIEHAHEQVPDPREVGGETFGVELERFCKVFLPTSLELRRLLGRKLATDITRIKYEWPDENLCMRHPDHENGRNATYTNFITELREACSEAFPVKMDMTKIALCKQEDGETVAQYLHRLTDVHNAHSGLTAPQDMSEGAVTAYEAHLRNSFMNGLIPGISDKVKNLCITWDTGKLSLIIQHALHAEKLLAQNKQEQEKKKEAQTHKVQLTIMQAVARSLTHRGRGRGRRGRGRRGRGGDSGCFICGGQDHWANGCPERGKVHEHQHLRSRRSVLKEWDFHTQLCSPRGALEHNLSWERPTGPPCTDLDTRRRERLKMALQTTPTLGIPDPNKLFVQTVDEKNGARGKTSNRQLLRGTRRNIRAHGDVLVTSPVSSN
ncbi:uncharacterized protein LOC113659001 [Tachysurus fulvidraco]|uniref:uncharacterized protein LOC113659001 n=1 Tax=Tachysurus fulvidraco TaxID=1234273 RepID=UPI001FF01733|nr:uncharacterized protein LOC113659001 [Tachysurus fulvidraco]